MKEVIDLINELQSLKQKFDENELLDLDELDKLFLFFQVDNYESLLSDPRFEYQYFRQLYIIYGHDLEFKSTFYKRNVNKKISEFEDYKKLQELNRKEYNHDEAIRIKEYLIKYQYYIPIDLQEVEKNKQYFKEITKKWALICLNEKHSDEELKVISKETRFTLKKKNIESYLEDKLNYIEITNVFKGLLKTYFIFHEVKKILRKIKKNNEPISFIVNSKKIEITFYSLVHIFNRHYAEILSSDDLISTKSFHDSKIDPSRINLFIEKLFSLLNQNYCVKRIEIKKGESLIINYKETKYVLFFDVDKYDKTKIILKTFFTIESENPNAHRFINKIELSEKIKLDNELSIYLE
ncbi:MAG: hypothetical protein FGM14_00205 [Flavobacteriales bacterium]|nr:hypothetical protein [Flavobacteriales bacterium]